MAMYIKNIPHFYIFCRWVSQQKCIVNLPRFGTCYTSSECTKHEGSADGDCASKFGTCCKFSNKDAINSCSAKINQNNTYFENPTILTSTCSLEVCPVNKDICQFRLDLELFQLGDPIATAAVAVAEAATMPPTGLGGSVFTLSDNSKAWTSHPNQHGSCLGDSFTATSTGAKQPPTLCGLNNGQHMYIEADGKTCSTLKVNLADTTKGQKWRIRVTQIECKSPGMAPKGCLQYFTGPSGKFSSFNYNSDAAFATHKNIHLADLDYNICLRQEKGMCSIQYEALKFQVSAVGETKNFGSGSQHCNQVDLKPLPAPLGKAGPQTQLGNDYITILNAIDDTDTDKTASYDRFCGLQLHSFGVTNNLIKSKKLPFRVGVHFDGDEDVGTAAELESTPASAPDSQGTPNTKRGDAGFEMKYSQHSTGC